MSKSVFSIRRVSISFLLTVVLFAFLSGCSGDDGSRGADGASLNWLGTYATHPAEPGLYDAYYNSTDGNSYIFDGTEWVILAGKGDDGSDGLSINWLGDLPEPPDTPELYDAYFNTTDGNSYIYNGTEWNLLAGAGADGLDGLSINWLGELDHHPAEPEIYDAYYNTTDGKSYIFVDEDWDILAGAGADGAPGDDGISIVWLGSFSQHPISPEVNNAYYNTTLGIAFIWDGAVWQILYQGSSNVTPTAGYTFLGSNSNDAARSIRQTSDGGYIIVGRGRNISTLQGKTPRNPHSGAASDYILVIRLDSSGNTLWYTFLGSSDGTQGGSSVEQTSDGGYIVSGRSTADVDELQGRTPRNAYTDDANNMLVVRLNSFGDVVWYTFVPVSGTYSSIQQASDGGYVAAGSASASIVNLQGVEPINGYSAGTDMFVIKFDTNGDTEWYTFLGSENIQEARDIKQSSDGGYILVGRARSIASLEGKDPIRDHSGGSVYDMLVVKLTASGDVDWFTFLGGGGYDEAVSIDQTYDGGYVIGGTSAGFSLPGLTPRNPYADDVWSMVVIKIDSGGDPEWFTFLGATDAWLFCRSIQQTQDGGFFIAGSNEFVAIASLQGKTPLYGSILDDGFGVENEPILVKLDSSGYTEWFTYLGESVYGEIGTASARQTSDGGYVFAGATTGSSGSWHGKAPLNPSSGTQDIIVIKLYPNGMMTMDSWY